jgi:hypothetical protein
MDFPVIYEAFGGKGQFRQPIPGDLLLQNGFVKDRGGRKARPDLEYATH